MIKLQIDRARQRLLGLQQKPGVWGYRARTIEAVEPSSLASLALLATEAQSKGEGDTAALASAGWLASIRNRNGSLGVTPKLPEPGWTTPFGLLLWSSLGQFAAERASAVAWLLQLKGETSPQSKDDPMGHNTSIAGWPWVSDTHSWVEPTAMAVIALAREGKADHPRVVEGLKLLADRVIPESGWNLGNPVVFKTRLRPLPGPTGQALLALARLDGSSTVAGPAIAYLHKELAETLAPISLGWGVLGLRAWGSEPSEGEGWLMAAFDRLEGREPVTVELAMLLLAAGGDRSLGLFGLDSRKGAARHA
jgi:hypothetical protein